MFSFKTLVAAVALATLVAAQRTIQILAVQDLSLEDTFVFKPREIRAGVGDMLEFHFAPTAFLASNHSVAQGTFERACEPLSGGFYSGNVTALPKTPTPENPLGETDQVFQVMVTTTQPMVFYCTLGQHCTRGMYGVVNPTDSQNLDSYKATIPKNGPAVAPARVQGGRLAPNPGVFDVSRLPAAAGSFQASMVGIVGAMAFTLMMM